MADTARMDAASDRDVQSALEYAKAHLACAREDRDIPGLSAAVVYHGETLWAGGCGYADAAAGRPAAADTVYPLASITKVVTCHALMRLRDEGKLQLDDPISRFIRPFPVKRPSPDTPDPTLRQIASHTAGFQRETPFECWETLVFPGIEELLAALAEVELVFPPLKQFKYSNIAYALLGHVVELVTGRAYTEYVETEILAPLGMPSSAFEPQGEAAARVTKRYPWCDEKGPGEPGPPLSVGCFYPVGGLCSTVEDMARFAAFHLGHGPDGSGSVLARASAREMQTPVWVQPDGSGGHAIGWGWAKTAGRFAVGHSGGLPGLSTDLRLVPELDLATAVFTNGGGVASEVNTELIEILAPAFARARKRREPKKPKSGLPAPAEWSAYVGKYESVISNQELEVHLIDGQLLLRTVGTRLADVVTLEPKSEHTFTLRGGASEGDVAIFEVDAAGAVVGLTTATYPFRRKG
ncbi:MAG: serine hydrolase [Armatimonadetes bacterium]|nr:serine hydrolase [Armatimonadota bacterium]